MHTVCRALLGCAHFKNASWSVVKRGKILTDVDVLGVQRSPDGVAQNQDVLKDESHKMHHYFTGKSLFF